MTAEERTLILGALFHDIGKFEQRCTKNPNKKFHQTLGKELIESGMLVDKFIKIVGRENLQSLLNIITEHHNKETQSLTKIVQIADHLSASERVDKEEVEAYQDQWKHKHLASLFSKINLLNDETIPPRYYKHKFLVKDEYDVIIPTGKTEEEMSEYAYNDKTWENFLDDLYYVLDIYENENDFESLLNLILIIFEKYMWCIPDFTGNSETDISLFNHLKDVAGFAHAIYLSQLIENKNQNLNLIIGDIPGIQGYIFDVVNRKPAKILRGRSIFVQILTRNLATRFLKKFKLTETNLIMLAGGKFYIIAPSSEDFNSKFQEIKKKINSYLFNNFRMDLSFNCAYQTFNYEHLMNKDNPLTFGQIVENASHKLIENRYNLFNERLFSEKGIEYKNYIWEEKYIENDGSGTDSIKCRVTDKPIRDSRKDEIKIPTDDGLEILTVDKQVAIEYTIGEKIIGNNIIAIVNEDGLSIDPKNIVKIKDFKENESNKNKTKLLLNPTLGVLLKKENYSKDVFRNTHYVEVANYCSKINQDVMPFEDMAEENDGAKFLSLIKGDIDNLGLIMAYGLSREKNEIKSEDEEKDLTAISRTTTLSNHLKYFFSFFLNGFLADWENKKQKGIELVAKQINPDISKEELKKLKNENRVYTIFAGGDDLMLVTPQSSAIKLVNELNKKFAEFVCDNNEVHISYSITHFKDHTPVRLVADFAENNQTDGKKNTKDSQYELLEQKNVEAFYHKNDKAGTYLFDSFVKNENLEYLLEQINKLTTKAQDEKSGLSKGLIRRLLELSETLKKYEETDDASYLIAYARLNHTVNRLLKNKDSEIKKFFSDVLTINKEDNEDAQKLEKILHPLVCQVIYNLRK